MALNVQMAVAQKFCWESKKRKWEVAYISLALWQSSGSHDSRSGSPKALNLPTSSSTSGNMYEIKAIGLSF